MCLSWQESSLSPFFNCYRYLPKTVRESAIVLWVERLITSRCEAQEHPIICSVVNVLVLVALNLEQWGCNLARGGTTSCFLIWCMTAEDGQRQRETRQLRVFRYIFCHPRLFVESFSSGWPDTILRSDIGPFLAKKNEYRRKIRLQLKSPI